MHRFHQPVEDHEVLLHGIPLSYRSATCDDAAAPTVVLIHGMAGSSRMWLESMQYLAASAHVIAPDLLGHGQSGRGRSLDYSIGNQASVVRDLLLRLGIERATIVGQSLGGGVAMQFAYQFPERTERLVLVDAGGLGKEVTPLLRLLSLPGSGFVLGGVTAPPVMAAFRALAAVGHRLGMRLAPEEREMAASFDSLADPATRRSFLATLRSVVDFNGQAVSGRNRLYLTEAMPVMVCWGDRDSIIPSSHAALVSEALPHAHVEIFPGAGHFPQCSAPGAFADALLLFIEATEPAAIDVASLRTMLAG